MPTIKFYVREGLLPAGELTSPNQASYAETHVQRLRLIRALLDVGGMPVADIREVIAAIDDSDQTVHQVLGAATKRMVPRCDREPSAGLEEARERIAELIAAHGWQTYSGGQTTEALVAALAALHELGHGAFDEVLDVYADAAERVAQADLEYVARYAAREELVERVAAGTVLGDAIFSALRRLAQVDASERIFGESP
ncbi:MerR family transcriptional regulator [Streptomyces sp. NPDC058872]|uniref:MerR family transcriptional regulator n=1 Tax=Streptomyces sp. NPDC058872 TaxID=3346661 RepID=UPI003686269B